MSHSTYSVSTGLRRWPAPLALGPSCINGSLRIIAHGPAIREGCSPVTERGPMTQLVLDLQDTARKSLETIRISDLHPTDPPVHRDVVKSSRYLNRLFNQASATVMAILKLDLRRRRGAGTTSPPKASQPG